MLTARIAKATQDSRMYVQFFLNIYNKLLLFTNAYITDSIIAKEVIDLLAPKVRGVKVFNNNGCHYRLACSGHALTEQRLLALLDPVLEFIRLQQPFSSSFLTAANEVTLLSIVNGCKLV